VATRGDREAGVSDERRVSSTAKKKGPDKKAKGGKNKNPNKKKKGGEGPKVRVGRSKDDAQIINQKACSGKNPASGPEMNLTKRWGRGKKTE